MSTIKNTSPIPKNHITPSPQSAPSPKFETDFYRKQKIAVIGSHQVGKSALSIQCVENRFEENYTPTVEDTYQWNTNVDGIDYDVTIVDTDGQDGQDDSAYLQTHHTIGIDGYILIFSIRNEQSFQSIKSINQKLLDTLNVTQRVGTSEIPRVLVGNQADDPRLRRVSKSTALQFANEQGLPYIESSAYNSSNVQEAFNIVIRQISDNLQQSHMPQSPQTSQRSSIPDNPLENADENDNNARCIIQ